MPSSLDNRLSNIYEPVFLFVKKESKYKYYLSLDKLRLPVSNFTNNKKPEDILGLEVENSLFKSGDVRGVIKAVFRNNEGNILAQVDWEDGKQTIEPVNDFDKESQIEINLVCQNCRKIIQRPTLSFRQ